MEDVPWDQALDTILQVKNLRSDKIGNVIWVITYEEFNEQRESLKAEKRSRAEEEVERARRAAAELDLAQQREALKPLVTEIVTLSYIDAVDVWKMILNSCGAGITDRMTGGERVIRGKSTVQEDISCIMSARGSLMLDEYNNAIIVKDIIENVTKIN